MGNYISVNLETVRDTMLSWGMVTYSSLQDTNMTTIAKSLTAATSIYLAASFMAKCYKTYQIRRALSQLHNKPHVLFGNIHEHPGRGPEAFKYVLKQTAIAKTMYQFWFGPFLPVVILVHPDTAKIILKSSEPKYTNNDGSLYTFVQDWLGDGLLVASGAKWFRNRRLLTPAFHFEILKPYLAIYHEAAETFLNKMAHLGDNGKQSVPTYSYVSLLTLDIILRCAFSYEGDIQAQGKNDPYISSVMTLTELLVNRLLNPLHHNEFIYHLTPTGRRYRKARNYVHNVAEEVIKKRKQALSVENQHNTTVHILISISLQSASLNAPRKRYLDFLDILLAARDDEGNGLTDMEIRNEVDTFLFEGHDTTASSISWILYELAKHPDIQTKVRAELQDIIGQRANVQVEWEHLSRMQFFSQCIKEAMRLHAPVPVIGRQLTQDLVIGGHTIPKDMSVGISIYAMHHNPVVWGEDHMEFKPERFSQENMAKRDAYDFIPFSAGSRNCIGQNFALNEERVVVAKTLLRFEIQVDPNHKVEMHAEAVTRPTNDIKLFFKPL